MVSELLRHPDAYNVRALTRDPTKPAAQSLAARGAEVYRADIDNGPDTLAAAFEGAHAIYALTDFWQTQSATAEIVQGKAIVDAAARITTLEHLIWSAIPNPERMSGGKFLHVNHWKSKSLVTEYIQQKPELWTKTTTILFPNYFENCLTSPGRYLPAPDAHGVYSLSFPHSPETVMPNVSIADTGKLVRTILETGPAYFTKTIAFYSQALSETEKLAALGESMLQHDPVPETRLILCLEYNIPTRYHKISADEFQQILRSRDGMSAEMTVDFAEQLMIFEECGNIYARTSLFKLERYADPYTYLGVGQQPINR